MSHPVTPEVKAILAQRFGRDTLLSLATADERLPHVRVVNSCHGTGSFYIITCALSNKMKQIANNPTVSACGEWFTGHGTAEDLGYIYAPQNTTPVSPSGMCFPPGMATVMLIRAIPTLASFAFSWRTMFCFARAFVII